MPWFIYLSNSAEGFPCHSILGSQEHTENPKTYRWKKKKKKMRGIMTILEALFPSKEKASTLPSSSLGSDLCVGSGHNQEVPPPIYSW